MSESSLIAHRIGGAPADGSDRRGDVFDPATGEVQARVAFADAAIVDAAVAAAGAASRGWRDTPLTRRAEVLFRFRSLLLERLDDVATVISREHGKVRADAMGEIRAGLDVLEFACGIPHLMKGEYSENVSTNVDTHSLRQPLGVVAGITPFNFPFMVPMWMIPIAIGCGNAFVLKPSEKDPSASLLIADALAEAGLPDGVFNVVHGDKVAVDALLTHPGIAAVSSVGSTPVARHIYETASTTGKRVQALGGAKNHMVVMPDCDMDLAADSAVNAGYGSTGQRCMAISAVVAVAGAADALIQKVGDRIATLKVGPGLDPASQMGPLVTAESRDRVLSLVDRGVDEGARPVVDGRHLKVEGHENGFFVGPTVLDQVTPEMTVYREEIFGPVLVVVRVDTLGEAIELVNANPYGNGTAIFTNDGGAARTFQHEIEVGMVGVNVPIPVPLPFYSFGGWKGSLFGSLHMYGPDGIRFFTRGKVVTSRWPDASARGVDLGFPGAKRTSS
jgi:malonate-semialdehyde dehydrogenase (acetylating) / methylmalonate-semialdehyde dehydrogenase